MQKDISDPPEQPNLNDLVDEIHRQLTENDPAYRRLLWAVYDEQAVEGSLATDNIMAAKMIRDRAKQIDSEIKDEKLHTIVMALGIVLRRYGQSRKERRLMVAGERVPDRT